MASIADYPDAVERIVSPDNDSDLSDGATSKEEVKRELSDRGENRLTDELIENLADAIVTEGDLRDLVEGADELPDQQTLESLAEIADEYDLGDRTGEIAEQVADDILTEEELTDLASDKATNDEIREAIEQSDSTVLGPDVSDIVEDTGTVEDVLDEIDTPTPTEEQIEEIAEQVTDDSGRSEIVADRAAEETTTQEQFNSEVAQSVGEETPDDISTGVGVLSDESGEAVAVFGGTSESRREQAADSLEGDVQDLGGNVNEALGQIEQVESGSGVEARINGQTITEVSPE
jgi:hypothetical protein